MNILLKHALAYQRLGWSVIPIKPGRKEAMIRWTEFQSRRASLAEIARWWRTTPNANVGVVTGLISNLVVVDIDSAIGCEAYIAKFGKFHSTIMQSTGKENARHLLFKHPGDQKYRTMARLYDSLDIRADGGYIVVPPSAHPSGRLYRWTIDPIEMRLDDLLKLPGELRDELKTERTDGRKSVNEDGWIQEALFGVEEGYRNDTCTKLAGFYLRLFENDMDRVEEVLMIWNKRNKPPMDEREIRQVVTSVGRLRRSGR